MGGAGELDGKVLGERYRLKDEVGRGGMGTVYAAVQTSLDREVAIKILLPVLSTDPALIARFKSEAEQAARLNHPNIIQVLDFGREADGSVWFAMELLEGEPLSKRIEGSSVAEDELVRIAEGALAGLSAAHAVPLVHRDLKPDNLFLQKTAGVGVTVKILDFGIAKLLDGDRIAKLTATGHAIGTPLYMAPEQARGQKDVDGRADLYSLGAVLYEALTGRPPFVGDNYNALLVEILTATPPPLRELRPDVTPAFADVITRALAKDREERFASADEMLEALRSFEPKTEAPPSREALGLASTMATPQPAVPTTQSTPIPDVEDSKRTPESAAPASPTPKPAAATPAAPIASPTTRTEDDGGRPAWVAPALVAAALLVGVGGTYALMGEGDATPPEVAHVTPATVPVVIDAAVADVLGSAEPRHDGDDTPTTEANTLAAEDAEDAEDDRGEPRPEDTERRRPRMRYARQVLLTPRVVRAEGHVDWARQGNLRQHADWNGCWPMDRPLPEQNRAVSIEASTTAEGDLIPGSYGPQGGDTYPDIRRCLQQLLNGVSLGPSETGEGGRVLILFRIRPAGPWVP